MHRAAALIGLLGALLTAAALLDALFARKSDLQGLSSGVMEASRAALLELLASLIKAGASPLATPLSLMLIAILEPQLCRGFEFRCFSSQM